MLVCKIKRIRGLTVPRKPLRLYIVYETLSKHNQKGPLLISLSLPLVYVHVGCVRELINLFIRSKTFGKSKVSNKDLTNHFRVGLKVCRQKQVDNVLGYF